MLLPADVQSTVDAYLGLVDVAVPGLVEGLYLVGSVALDDYRPGASDVDFVAVTAARPDPRIRAALGRVHRRLARRPRFEGVYVTWSELAADPASAGRDPVTWHTLAGHGLGVRGPERSSVAVWTDEAALAAWCRTNLDSYWRRWHRQASLPLSRRSLACLRSWGPAWAVLGVSRLHYTIATGRITSKYGAGRYARDVFGPQWTPIVGECLRIRAGASLSYPGRLARRRDALAFLDMAIDDALRTRR